MKTLFAFIAIAAATSLTAFANSDPQGYTKAYDCGLKDISVVSKGSALFVKEVEDGEAAYYPLKLKGRHVSMGVNNYDSEIAVFSHSSGMTVSYQLFLKEDRQHPHPCQPSLAL